MPFDERLEDRHLPFLDKLSIAQNVLDSMTTAAELESLMEWTFSTLLKLSKAQNPRPEVFTADPLWTFIHGLFERCFPTGKRVKVTKTAGRHGRVHCRQPILPAFVCYCKLYEGQEPSVPFVRAFNNMFDLVMSSRLDVNGLLQHVVELCQSGRRFAGVVDKCVQMLLRLYERQDTKKSYSYLLSTMPEIVFEGMTSAETVLMIVKFLLHDTSKCIITDALRDAIVKMPLQVQLAFLRAYLTTIKANLSLDEYRKTGFALCRHLISSSPRASQAVIECMNGMNVYVHKNDDIYAEQQSFLSELLPTIDSVDVVTALLDLDFYLILERLDKLPSSLLADKQTHLSLYRHAVQSRQLDDVIKALRLNRVAANQDALFEALLLVDRLLVRHYEESVGEERDAYWVVLVYLCGFEPAVVETKLREAHCLSEEEILKLLRFYDPLNAREGHNKESSAFVPEMTSDEFKVYINKMAHEEILVMLQSPVFYELSQLQKPFEQWLLKADPNVQSAVLLKCPSDYLSNKTVKQLLNVPECVRMVKRRPTVIKHILNTIDTQDYHHDLLKLAARFAVKSGRKEHVERVMQKSADLLLQVRPINPQIADIVLQFYDAYNHRFIPYILLQPNGMQQYPITDPTASLHYPYLYNVKLADVTEATVEMAKEYPLEEQLEFLSKRPQLILQMLQERQCRAAAIQFIRDGGKADIAVVDCLVQLTKDVPYDSWLHQLALKSGKVNPTTLLSLAIHRPAVFDPSHITDYTRALLALPLDDAWCKIVSQMMLKRGRVVDEALLVLLVHALQSKVEWAAESRVGEVARRVGKQRVETGRVMALLGDEGKARLRDLLGQ